MPRQTDLVYDLAKSLLAEQGLNVPYDTASELEAYHAEWKKLHADARERLGDQWQTDPALNALVKSKEDARDAYNKKLSVMVGHLLDVIPESVRRFQKGASV